MKKDDKVIFHNTRLLLEHYRNDYIYLGTGSLTKRRVYGYR